MDRAASDVCKGDTVMFTQEVYQKFDKVTRRGCLIGKRSIAGRIVKESYGAAKQQHTFTRWKNEAERSRVLAEKHKRGAAARHVRGLKKKRKKLSTYSAAKHQKHSHHKPSRTKQTTERHRENFADRREKHAVRIATPNARHQKPVLARQNKTKQSRNSRASASCMRHENLARPLEGRDPTFHPYSHPSQALGKFYRQRAPLGSPSLPMSLPHFRHWADPYVMPTSESRGFNHSSYPHYAYPNPYYEAENFNRFPQFMNPCNPLHPYSSQTETFDQRKYGL
ncbi:hypothetical protein RJ639_042855 [Escallonia herrerae]|uniref:DUF7699 domain-containing protein n=1 Tax=Escallonia herrerae TaxID=1293975 RepID=A0AA88WEF7_9ASTE|nr:hypothetical protein RJ639_042855 [Escallonia herrerae]